MAGVDDSSKYHHLNSAVLDQLHIADEYPPISRPMFAMTVGTLECWQSRAIHFGWSTKNFDAFAAEWIVKFERLLMDLYWWEARVQMELEILGKIEIHWEIDAISVRNWQSHRLELPNRWNRTIIADAGVHFTPSLGQSKTG